MKKIFLTFLCVLIAMQSITAANSIYIDDVEAKPGDIVTLSVQMTNTETDKYCGFQFDVVLPEGISFVQDDGFYEAALSTERTTANKTNFFDSALQSDGSLRILCNTSANNSSVGHLYCFSGTSGEICTIKIKIDETLVTGEYSVKLQNVSISDYSSVSHTADDYTMRLDVKPIEVSSVSLNKSSLTITEGDVEKLTATVIPASAIDQSITWTTSDANVAKVDKEGNVTAVAEGAAIITATSGNGKTAQCAVIVSRKPNPVTAIALNKTTLKITEGDSETLTVTYTPADADDRNVTWTSSDNSIATVDANGKVTAVAEGAAIITATSGNGKIAQCVVIIEKDTESISFADSNVKAICVENWDTNGDGKLSKAEAAAVSDLGEVFKDNKEIISFDELQYFTGLTEICDSAFSGCSGLTSVVIPDNVTRIGEGAFSGCSNLQSIIIPESVIIIGQKAFEGCEELVDVTILGKNPATIEAADAFSNYDITLNVPYGSKEKYEEADYWKDFKDIVETVSVRGDVNHDGSVTMADANMVVNYFLATDKPDGFDTTAADINGDGDITMADANQIVNMFLSGGQ